MLQTAEHSHQDGDMDADTEPPIPMSSLPPLSSLHSHLSSPSSLTQAEPGAPGEAQVGEGAQHVTGCF